MGTVQARFPQYQIPSNLDAGEFELPEKIDNSKVRIPEYMNDDMAWQDNQTGYTCMLAKL